MARRATQVVVGGLLGVGVTGLVVLLTDGAGGDAGPSRHVLPDPLPVAPSELTTESGERVLFPDTAAGDGLDVVFFGYTHCPDVCPLTMSRLARVIEGMEADLRSRLDVHMVTVDPARDTPARLGEWLRAFDPSFRGLTGTPEEIRRAAGAWGVWIGPLPTDSAGYTVDHTGRTFVVDGQGRIVASFGHDARESDIAAVLSELADARR